MNCKSSVVLTAILMLVFAVQTVSAATSATVFSDNMVLQREMPVPVWGIGTDGEKVTVSFAGQTKTTTVADGKWMVELDPLKTSAKPAELKINDTTISGVLVGEVWLCSGQSNMAWRMASDKSNEAEGDAEFPLFRYNGRGNGMVWQALDPKTRPGCSATAYHFGKKLHKDLGVPVGLVIRSVGGTLIETWMPKETMDECSKQLGMEPNGGAGAYWKRFVEPLIPMAARGMIWYQGERNAKTGTAWKYQYMLPHFIKAWRKAFRRGEDFWLLSVQIPVQDGGVHWPILRDASRRAMDTVPGYGMIVYYDKGYQLHPVDKTASGERLALWALAKSYGKDLVYSGPLLKDMKIEGNKAVLSFNHTGGGLQNPDGGDTLKYFEVLGDDGKWAPADAKVVGQTVEVSAKGVTPKHVRYIHLTAKPCVVGLCNKEGLPASPFNTKPAEDK